MVYTWYKWMAHRKCSVNASSLAVFPTHPISSSRTGTRPYTYCCTQSVQCCVSGGAHNVDLLMVVVVGTQDTTIKHKVPITTCYRQICFSFKINIPKCWYLKEGLVESEEVMRTETSWSGLVPLWKRLQRDPLETPPGEDTVRKHPLWTRKRAIIRKQSCWHLDFGLPAFRTLRNNCLLFLSYPAGGICYNTASLID